MRLLRHITLFLIFGLLPEGWASAQSLLLHLDGDHLRATAPELHFLSGKAVEKLRNGSTIAYTIALAVTPRHASRAAFLVRERFLISFDLWEEKYSVVQDKPGGRAASRLTSAMAEAWCLDNMPIPVQSVPDRQPFMVTLECFIDKTESSENGENQSGLTLAALIDVFSRKKQEKPVRWQAVGGPFLLEDLKGKKKSR